MRGEVFSTRLSCDGRTYFFNVKENRTEDLYITIVESKPTESGNFDRRSIVVFEDNAEAFLKTFQKALAAIRETVPASKPPRTKREAADKNRRDDGRPDPDNVPYDDRPRHYIALKKQKPEETPAEKPPRKVIKKTGRVLRVKTKKVDT